MREIVIILCAVMPLDADTVAAIPCAVVRQYEGPVATIDVDADDAIVTTGEVVS